MVIKVLGTKGCINCEELYEKINNVLKQKNYDVDLQKITSVLEISKYSVTSIPGLVVNDKLICQGIVPSENELKKIIETGKISEDAIDESKCCNGVCKF